MEIRAVRKERVLGLQATVHAAGVVVAEADELVGPGDGQPLQHRGVDEGEDGDVGAEPEGKCQGGDGAEAGTMSEAARCDPKIVDQGVCRHWLL